jgi:3-methyl-2-oxobutanoate hydroxymethyltransferase
MEDKKKVTVKDLLHMKGIEKISVLTAYDYSMSRICDRAGVDVLLVGDSAGMVMLGYSNTAPVSMNEMMTFCNAVARGTKRAMRVGDMPFGSYQPNSSIAIKNAVKLIKAGCDAVKLEGGKEMMTTIKAIIDAGIPVMGHIGLKPQTSSLWEGYKIQGKTKESAMKLVQDAKSLDEAGVFSMVVEMVTAEVADTITHSVSVPTIGIGSGINCDGQVLVIHDMLGIYQDIRPKFVKRYAELNNVILGAVSNYARDIKSGHFPEESNTFHMDQDEILNLERVLNEEKKK